MEERVKITIVLEPTKSELVYYVTKETKDLLEFAQKQDKIEASLHKRIVDRLEDEIGNEQKIARIIKYYRPSIELPTRQSLSSFATTPLGQFCLGISSFNKTLTVLS
jgi:hypothetical protein